MKKIEETMVLNKFLAAAGICSRRKAVEEIKAGAVRVNDHVIVDPAHEVKPTDRVMYQGKRVIQEDKVYLLLNKPEGFVTTVSDELNRPTVLDLINTKEMRKKRLFPVGRLDLHTTGLLLITNDGELAQRLAHPTYQVSKTYKVTLDQPLDPESMRRIQQGIKLEDGFVKADSLYFAKRPNRKRVIVEIHSGKNRIIRRIFKAVGYNVVELERIGYAGLTKQGLPKGCWRPLSKKEVEALLQSEKKRARKKDE